MFGERLALKGNLHTTDVILLGTPDDVRRESKRCIDAAAGAAGLFSPPVTNAVGTPRMRT